jgi:hypothetical protein
MTTLTGRLGEPGSQLGHRAWGVTDWSWKWVMNLRYFVFGLATIWEMAVVLYVLDIYQHDIIDTFSNKEKESHEEVIR